MVRTELLLSTFSLSLSSPPFGSLSGGLFRYLNPDAICNNTALASFSTRELFRFRRSSKSIPRQYSNTVANDVESISNTSYNCTTRGWFMSLWILYSRDTCLIYEALRSSFQFGFNWWILMATSLNFNKSNAFHTSLKPPLPNKEINK